jgi:membrane protease YdiL (CAAX protease family)
MTIIEKIADKKQIASKFWTVKQGILAFCVLAYSLSWGWWGIRFAPFWEQLISYGQPISRSQIGILDIQIGMFGPLIAAIVMRLWISKEPFRFSLKLSHSWIAYLFAVLMPTGLVITAIMVNGVTGIGRFNWAGDSVLQVILNFVLIIPLAAASAIGEEYGWRGYLLPRLLQGNEITASIVAGLIWAFWHLPLLITGISFPGQPVTLAIPVFAFTIVINSFLFTWLHRLSGGSFWTAALLHGILNALTELTSVKHYPDSNQLVVGVFGLTYAVILTLCVFVYYLIQKHGFVAHVETAFFD